MLAIGAACKGRSFFPLRLAGIRRLMSISPHIGEVTAIVLAGDRGPQDPLLRAAGVACKAALPVAGRPMLLRVLDALAMSAPVTGTIVCGSSSRLRGRLPEFEELLAAGKVCWLENETSPSLSAQVALRLLPEERVALVTTADHALLTPTMIDQFCAGAIATGCDVVAGVVRAELLAAAFPQSRRTVTHLRDVAFCGGNLFAFLTARGRRAAAFWRRVEQQRKHPLKIVRVLGFGSVLRYLLGQLTLSQALARLSTLIDARAGVVWMPTPEVAIDVDKFEDWMLAEEIIAGRQGER